jgi:tyrosine-protein phosphatase SIW14
MKGLTRRFPFVAVTLTLFATTALAQSQPRYKELPNFQRVNEQLYRGAQPAKGGMQKLAELGIKTVINLRGAGDGTRAEEREAEAAGLVYFNIPLKPYRRPEADRIERILSIINTPENQPVFIHCQRGKDRTGTVVAVYRIRHDNWTAAAALQEARTQGMRWLVFEMKDYIADTYRLKLKTAGADLTTLDDSKIQVVGTAATVARTAVENAYVYTRKGLKRLGRIVQ